MSQRPETPMTPDTSFAPSGYETSGSVQTWAGKQKANTNCLARALLQPAIQQDMRLISLENDTS